MRPFTTHHNGRFIVAVIENPAGYRPGRYFFVVHLGTGTKVSRYTRKIASAYRKAVKYERWYSNGDTYWPEVGRCDELRTNPDAVLSRLEFIQGHLGVHPCQQ